ncbi:MAG: hypothetical protein LBS90_08130 [Oscillospiraceae bacterium]|jgi:hypothetical protein|nr:hypothetical protein [Oscillospiraceae bacterium]
MNFEHSVISAGASPPCGEKTSSAPECEVHTDGGRSLRIARLPGGTVIGKNGNIILGSGGARISVGTETGELTVDAPPQTVVCPDGRILFPQTEGGVIGVRASGDAEFGLTAAVPPLTEVDKTGVILIHGDGGSVERSDIRRRLSTITLPDGARLYPDGSVSYPG